jgi:hypothetical protein
MLSKLLGALKKVSRPQVGVETLPCGIDFKIRSRGLRSSGLPEVEIVNCPARLCEVASNVILGVASNGLREPTSLAVGKIIGNRFVSTDQPLIEIFQFDSAESDSAVLRVVDVGAEGQNFPRQLIATHLCATAGSSARDALRLLLVATEVWPIERRASNAALEEFEVNPNNFWSWIDLGAALAKASRIDEAVANWKIAVCMWPRGGKLYAKRMLMKAPSPAWGSNSQAPLEFWKGITDESIKRWCSELAVEVTEEALVPGVHQEV